jgi:hypothetical protein
VVSFAEGSGDLVINPAWGGKSAADLMADIETTVNAITSCWRSPSRPS